MTRLIRTLNSVYEIDFENSRVRRLSGQHPHVLKHEDGEWQEFLEAKRISPDPLLEDYVWFFTLPDTSGASWLRTSLVQGEEDAA